MQTDTILNGILALLVAQRDGDAGRPTERILADAGPSDDATPAGSSSRRRPRSASTRAIL